MPSISCRAHPALLLYYGSGELNALARHERVVLQANHYFPSEVKYLSANGTAPLAYLSLGEDTGPDAPWQLSERNPVWGGRYVDPAHPGWLEHVRAQAELALEAGLGGLVLGTLYLGLIAQQVRAGRIDVWQALKRWPANLFWVGLFIVALPILLLIIYAPFLLLAAGFSVLGGVMTVVAVFVDWAGRLLALWLALFMIFTVHGVLLHEKNALAALWDSVRVVQWNMTSTMLLVLLLVVLSLAMGTIWNMAPAGSWLAVAGMVGNAFISTALVAASFIYYKDRYRYWREMRAELIAELERRRAEKA